MESDSFENEKLKEEVKANDRELISMIESIRAITSSLELEEVLNKIITSALQVITAADAGYLQLYDIETERLIPRAAVGFNEKLKSIKVKTGESITGKVFRDGIPVIYYSRPEIYEGMAGISTEHFHSIQEANDNAKLQSLISVPVSVEEKKIGVMTVHQYDAKGKLSERDLHLLQGFAAQAAVAIHNAQLYKKANDRLEEVTLLTTQLKEKNDFLSKRAEVHETLTKLSLQNQSVEFIIRELNRMMKRDIFFFDYLNTEFFPKRTLSYPSFSHDEISRLLAAKSEPFYIDLTDKKTISCYVYPLLSNRVTLGCFIIPLFSPLSKLDQTTIEQASSILALELTKRKTQAEVYYKKTHDLFNELLQNKNSLFTEEAVQSLGLSPYSCFTVYLLEIASYPDLQTLEAIIHRLTSKIKKRVPEKNTVIFGFHHKVTILFSAKNPYEMKDLISTLHAAISQWESREDPPLYAGGSTAYKGISRIAACYNEADKALTYLTGRHQTGIINYEEIGINRLFLTQPPDEIERFTNDILSPLRTEKARNNDLENTLFTYIELNRSNTDTAKHLHIHTNTLYHRIKKIEELLQLEFNNPDDFLQILLACHLWKSFVR
ncbi:helix-turn-helix domain-containing protein [Bacillus sp. B190/17]|uniref:Helix-turn-helix domain-containing protein n=1 Tax=Bacillus lumedeiriae TaxID=3058829 RepID=A0ABW8I9P3_9BACI